MIGEVNWQVIIHGFSNVLFLWIAYIKRKTSPILLFSKLQYKLWIFYIYYYYVNYEKPVDVVHNSKLFTPAKLSDCLLSVAPKNTSEAFRCCTFCSVRRKSFTRT